jgi:hypothetical protein
MSFLQAKEQHQYRRYAVDHDRTVMFGKTGF